MVAAGCFSACSKGKAVPRKGAGQPGHLHEKSLQQGCVCVFVCESVGLLLALALTVEAENIWKARDSPPLVCLALPELCFVP